jgi:hypothetical protein
MLLLTQKDNNPNSSDLLMFYVKDIGFQIFNYTFDLLTKTISEEKPLSPYVASMMVSNFLINFVHEFISIEQDEKNREQIKQDMFNGIMKILYFENNKEIAQAITENPSQALEMMKQKYANMKIPDAMKREMDEEEKNNQNV